MLKKIEKILRREPGLKARAIAAELDEDRHAVNSTLYANREIFFQDDYRWFLVSQRELCVEFAAGNWLTASEFEKAVLAAGSPLDGPQPKVKFALAKNSKVMIDALARLLALSNQLVAQGKAVTLDFTDCGQTLTYLDRIGFFNHLHETVEVLPRRPRASRSTRYEGNNAGVVELLEIDPSNPNQNIPERLGNSFARCAGAQYSVGAFTVLAELFRNVEEHSETITSGFAGLQFYKRAKHIQAVISDSGVGIVESLRPVLEDRYSHVAEKVAKSREPGVALLKEVFSEGG
jgi:signal transduction histidine kinase